MNRETRDGGGGFSWDFIPPGGLWVLVGMAVMLLALACKLLAGLLSDVLVPVQLLLTAAALLLAGYGVTVRLREGGTLASSRLTGAVLFRLLAVLGFTLVLFGGTVFLTSPAESARIEEVLQAPTAPGGGLPDGIPRVGSGARVIEQGPQPPYPWLSYTYLAILFIGGVLGLVVGLGLLIRWAFYHEYEADEPGVAEPQTSTLIVLGAAAILAMLAYVSLAPGWDSGRNFLCVLSAVTLVGGLILVLPLAWRKVVACLLILLHFGGILSAVTAVEPPGAPPPWISGKVWGTFYRPYLEFVYLTNAYHFYSPEPGQACLLWARLEYADGRYRWLRMPSRSQEPVPMTYQRILAITESINQIGAPSGDMGKKEENRRRAELTKGIPIHNELPLAMQYREPSSYSRELLQSYVRYLARRYPTMDGQEVAKVKVYRVPHMILPPPLMAMGRQADDPWLYLPYYQGEFSPEGTLLNPDDPLLYWLIPILPRNPMNPDRNNIEDFLARHAGDR